MAVLVVAVVPDTLRAHLRLSHQRLDIVQQFGARRRIGFEFRARPQDARLQAYRRHIVTAYRFRVGRRACGVIKMHQRFVARTLQPLRQFDVRRRDHRQRPHAGSGTLHSSAIARTFSGW